tara:strand:+ start:1546 stop:2649 length:1104 start_codon:yes stop_codon:yes gene_type:complete
MAKDNNKKPAKPIGSHWFNSTKLSTPGGGKGPGAPYNELYQNGSVYGPDGSDMLANKGFVIDIKHVPSGRSLFFKAFIENYVETFSPDWNSETVYGRMDPIYQFKNTTRSISLALKIPAATQSEAYENLAKVQALAQFLYPTYLKRGSATTIAQSPLLRLGVMNLARAQSPGKGPETFASPQSYHTSKDGLLGILKSLTINHNLAGEAGVIERGKTGGNLLPKLIEINFDFDVIHEHSLGWDKENNFDQPAFPYGLDFEESAPSTKSDAAETAGDLRSFNTDFEAEQDLNSDYHQTPDQLTANAEARYAVLVPRPTFANPKEGGIDTAGMSDEQLAAAYESGEYDLGGVYDSSVKTAFDKSWTPPEK